MVGRHNVARSTGQLIVRVNGSYVLYHQDLPVTVVVCTQIERKTWDKEVIWGKIILDDILSELPVVYQRLAHLYNRLPAPPPPQHIVFVIHVCLYFLCVFC